MGPVGRRVVRVEAWISVRTDCTTNPSAKETYAMKKEKKLDPLMRPEDVAKKLGLSRKTIVVMAREDRIPHIRIGRYVRFDPAEIARWIDRRRS